MKKYLFYFNNYKLAICLVMFLALIVRTYNFSERWGLGSDDIRDISIAKEALSRKELPLIGSFSSAGPFVFGPLFYWFIMLSYLFFPFTLKAPWILLTFIGLVTVGFFMYIGNLLGGKRLALTLGILSATSPQLIARSIALNQHSLIGITVILLILFYILLWQRKNIKYAFLMGLSLGVALNMHYQAINLFLFFPLLFLVNDISLNKKLKAIIIMFVGFLIPSLPLLFWDSRQEFANVRNIIDYLLIGQYRIYVPNSWRLFLFNYLPNYWLFVEGGNLILSLVIIFFINFLLFFLIILKRLSGLIFTLAFIFFIMLVLNRYYRGERFEGYLMYFAPFVIIITGWCLSQLYRNSMRVVGLAMLFVIVSGNLFFSAKHVLSKKNREEEIKKIEKILIEKYPDKKFSLYDYEWRTSDKSYPLSAFLKDKNRISEDGIPVGIIWESKMYQIDQEGVSVIAKSQLDFIVDLTYEKTFKEKKKRWVNVSQESIYNDLMKWTKTEKLTSSFSF